MQPPIKPDTNRLLEQIEAPKPPSDEDRLAIIADLAAKYVDELSVQRRSAEGADDASDTLTEEKYLALLKANGIDASSTNNLIYWFVKMPASVLDPYKIETSPSPDEKPGVVYLRELATQEPELFERCVEAGEESVEEAANQADMVNGSFEDTLPTSIRRRYEITQHEVVWEKEYWMHQAIEKMESYGATLELINDLSE